MSELLIGILCLAFYLFARKAKPAKDQSGTALNTPQNWQASDNSEQLTVATYNVQTGKDTSGKRNILRSADIIKAADIVGIQEVYAPTWLNRFGLGLSQTNALAKQSNFTWLFAATRHRWFREHRGNALLSRFKVTQWQVKILPDQSGKSYRNMVIAQTTFKQQPLWIINTHLHTSQGRQAQLEKVFEAFERYPRAVLLGDFNSTASEPLIQKILADKDVTDAIAVALGDKDERQRIDWIFTKGLAVIGGEIVPKGVSDHPYYQVTLG